MTNTSILLVGGDLDGQTYTALEGEKTVRIHATEIKGVITDTEVRAQTPRRPPGTWYVYEQENEGSNRYVFKHTE